jgi:hypothetical protein
MQRTSYICQILMKIEFNFLEIFSKNPNILNAMKTLSRESSCSMQTNRRTERQTDIIKLIDAFRNLAKAPKNRLGQSR